MENIVIRKITCDEVESAMALALEVFMQFEAPDYGPAGVETFKKDIVENPEYLENAKLGACPIYGAFDGDKIVALMGMRSSKTHINLVFTKKEYHRKGIATAIFRYLLNDILTENPTLDALTLNSSPYGLPFYLALGFVPQSEEQEINGIRFTPMKYVVKDKFTEGTEMRLDGFGLFVDDMPTMIRFYRDVLGFEIKEGEDAINVYLIKDGTLFMLYERKNFEKMTSRKYEYLKGLNGHFEIALYVDTFEEVDEQYANAIAKGARSVLEPTTEPWGQRTCYIADPEGNLIEIGSFNRPFESKTDFNGVV